MAEVAAWAEVEGLARLARFLREHAEVIAALDVDLTARVRTLDLAALAPRRRTA